MVSWAVVLHSAGQMEKVAGGGKELVEIAEKKKMFGVSAVENGFDKTLTSPIFYYCSIPLL